MYPVQLRLNKMSDTMKNRLILRIIGSIVIVVGVVLVSNPELVSNKPVPDNTFDAVERRIWWGLIPGIGILLLFHHRIRPLKLTLAATLAALVSGLLVARVIGIVLDGSVLKQWLYVAIKVVILALLVWWYLKVRTPDKVDDNRELRHC